MTKIFAVTNFSIVALFLSLAGTRPGHANANRIALNCQAQQLIETVYSAKWDRGLKKVTLDMTEEEDQPSGPFSLLIDFKRNQAMYSEQGAWSIMNISTNSANKTNLYFEMEETGLGTDFRYIQINKRELSFELKYIFSWDNATVFKSKGQCQSVQESEIIYQYKPFPSID